MWNHCDSICLKKLSVLPATCGFHDTHYTKCPNLSGETHNLLWCTQTYQRNDPELKHRPTFLLGSRLSKMLPNTTALTLLCVSFLKPFHTPTFEQSCEDGHLNVLLSLWAHPEHCNLHNHQRNSTVSDTNHTRHPEPERQSSGQRTGPVIGHPSQINVHLLLCWLQLTYKSYGAKLEHIWTDYCDNLASFIKGFSRFFLWVNIN